MGDYLYEHFSKIFLIWLTSKYLCWMWFMYGMYLKKKISNYIFIMHIFVYIFLLVVRKIQGKYKSTFWGSPLDGVMCTIIALEWVKSIRWCVTNPFVFKNCLSFFETIIWKVKLLKYGHYRMSCRDIIWIEIKGWACNLILARFVFLTNYFPVSTRIVAPLLLLKSEIYSPVNFCVNNLSGLCSLYQWHV